MGIYLINFLVYSMAMVGLLFVCLMVYKKTMTNNYSKKNTEELTVENAMNLSARKTLYIVKAGDEKFLIASDAERTTFLAKLNDSQSSISNQIQDISISNDNLFSINQNEFNKSQTITEKQEEKGVDYTEVMNAIKNTTHKQPVMKEILRRLDQQTEAIQAAKE